MRKREYSTGSRFWVAVNQRWERAEEAGRLPVGGGSEGSVRDHSLSGSHMSKELH